ncbi:ribosome-associated translation inhibitor RaiA [bacterium]|nr:MAG: ribosome-associated translation inhibitor RaiA [bacterium]
MQIKIQSTGFELTPAIRELVEKKVGSLSKLLKRFEEKSEAIAVVEVSRTTKHHRHGDIFYAEINLNVSGKVIRAEDHNIKLQAALDIAKDKLKQEVLRFKERAAEKSKNR